MKSRRSKATDISDKIREKVLERDKACIYCNHGFMLGVAHKISRAKGGLGIPENLVVLCASCHHDLDHSKDKAIRENMAEYVATYLKLCYPKVTDDDRVYKKGE